MPKHITVQGGTAPPLVVDLAPVEQPDYDARLAAAQVTDADSQAQLANGQTLRQRVRQALAANATYLALASPTQAQVVAQVALLTRENSAVIRLLVGLLDSTTGT